MSRLRPILPLLVLLWGSSGGTAGAVGITDLGAFIPSGLNTKGVVVGSVIDETDTTSFLHAARWSGGTLTRLPERVDTTESEAFAVSETGRIVGLEYAPGHLFGAEVHAVYWDGEIGPTQLGPLLFDADVPDFSQAHDVDDAGNVVGTSSNLGTGVGENVHPYLGFYAPGAETPVAVGEGDLDADKGSTGVGAISGDGTTLLGEVRGTTSADGFYLWSAAAPASPGTPIDLTPPRSGYAAFTGSAFSALYVGNALASDGSVLGYKGNGVDRTWWLRTPNGTETQIVGLAGHNAVNASHVVAGTIINGTDLATLRAATWDAGTQTVTDLNTLLPPGSGFLLLAALAIADNGDIAGIAVHDGAQVGFLMTSGGQVVQGVVRDRAQNPVAGITIEVTGTADEGGAVSETTVTDAAGAYAVRVEAGVYDVKASGEAKDENGGALSAATGVGGFCAGTAADDLCHLDHLATGVNGRADFTYTTCAATGRRVNDKPITGCPVIFLPGFLGSRIVCDADGGGERELWPGLPFLGWSSMLLLPDGATNDTQTQCMATARPASGKAGLVASVVGTSVYRTTMDFLDATVGATRWSALPYDWRKAPTLAVPALDGLVDAVLDATGAKHVVLYGHSMGGLLLRAYVGDPTRADKVIRAVTAGTPYWGAPKAHFSLLEGDTDTPEWDSPLDIPTIGHQLQRLSQNLQGTFFLYPSGRYGPWLLVARGQGAYVTQDANGENDWVASLGAPPELLANARAWHAVNDGFPQTEIDWEVMVGAGSPTVVEQRYRRGVETWANIIYGSGDGTVPLRSATQGASESGVPAGKNVPIHYVCGVGHVALPGDAAVGPRIKDFITKGKAVEGPEDNCPYSGATIGVFKIDFAASNVVTNPRSREASERMSLADAATRGLVSVFRVGGRTTIVTDARRPVTLELTGDGLGMQIQQIASSGDGPVQSFPPLSGVVTVSTDGAVTQDGTAVKPVRPKTRGPRTVARVKRKGKELVVRLRAKAPNGVGATFYQLGDGASTRYVEPFRIPKAALKTLLIASVDIYGTAEKPHRAR